MIKVKAAGTQDQVNGVSNGVSSNDAKTFGAGEKGRENSGEGEKDRELAKAALSVAELGESCPVKLPVSYLTSLHRCFITASERWRCSRGQSSSVDSTPSISRLCEGLYPDGGQGER